MTQEILTYSTVALATFFLIKQLFGKKKSPNAGCSEKNCGVKS